MQANTHRLALHRIDAQPAMVVLVRHPAERSQPIGNAAPRIRGAGRSSPVHLTRTTPVDVVHPSGRIAPVGSLDGWSGKRQVYVVTRRMPVRRRLVTAEDPDLGRSLVGGGCSGRRRRRSGRRHRRRPSRGGQSEHELAAATPGILKGHRATVRFQDGPDNGKAHAGAAADRSGPEAFRRAAARRVGCRSRRPAHG